MKNKGFNKILQDKRLEKNLSLKEAAKGLGVSKTYLRLLENGYFNVSKKLQPDFIKFYNLKDDFFENDLGYPVLLEEEKIKVINPFWHKVINHRLFKFSCFVLTFLFIAFGCTGAIMNNFAKTDTTKFFSNEAVALREEIHTNPDVIYDPSNAQIVDGVVDKIYCVNNDDLEPAPTDSSISILCPSKEKNFLYTTFRDSYQFDTIMPVLEGEDLEAIQLVWNDFIGGEEKTLFNVFNMRSSFGSSKLEFRLRTNNELHKEFASVTANVYCNKDDAGGYKFDFDIKSVSFMRKTGFVKPIDEDCQMYEFIKSTFLNNAEKYLEDLNDFVENRFTFIDPDPITGCTLDTTMKSMNNGTKSFGINTISSMALLLVGIIFTCLFLALAVLYIFKKRPLEDSLIPLEGNKNFYPTLDGITRQEPLKKNIKMFPVLPGNLLKFISITMIFIYSLGFYFLFNSLTSLNLQQAQNIIQFDNWFSPFLIIAFLLLFFVKLDIVQEKKNYFLTNYFWFFSGLALYLLYVFIGETVLLDNTFTANIGTFLLEALPGNFLWGFLAFNMMVLLLFYTPLSVGNDKKKLFRYRCLAAIPVGYLVISLIIEIGDAYWGWNLPYAVTSLFFTKAVDLLVFALLFTFAVFIYKRWTVKKYGRENAELYQHGNKYYFVKNIMSATIVLIIGIGEICFHFCYPNNPLGMGEDYLILLTIPFILFYHPHHGQRSVKWDNIFLIYYDTAYAIGIVLIALSVIVSIIS